jgi:hypothetical protein
MPLPTIIRVVKRDARGRPIIGPNGQPVTGEYYNPIKQHVRAYWLTSTPDAAVSLAPFGTPGDEKKINFEVDNQGHFDWSSIVGNSTGAYTITFRDTGSLRDLSNRAVHSTTIVGSAVRKFNLAEPYFINVGDSERRIVATIKNLEPIENTVELVLVGRRFYHREAPPIIAKEIQDRFGDSQRTYSYFLVPNEMETDGTVEPVAIAGTKKFTFYSEYESDSELHKFMVASTGPFFFTIRELQSGRLIMNTEVNFNAGWGNAEFPFFLPDTYLLEEQQTLIMEVSNTSGVENFIYPTIAGRRIMASPFK